MFFLVLAVSESSIIRRQGHLKFYYFEIKIRAFLFGYLQNQNQRKIIN